MVMSMETVVVKCKTPGVYLCSKTFTAEVKTSDCSD